MALVMALGGAVGGVVLVSTADQTLEDTESSDDTSPGAAASTVTYAAAYTETVLTAPDDSYDFDITTGTLTPARSTPWAVGHDADGFLSPPDSDASITPSGRPTPAECWAAIDRQPATALAFGDLPAGHAFCVRSRSTHDIAIVRVITVADSGPVTISMDYYRNGN
ncbi:hypothetical protein [Streptomyces sp. KS 21]|uniref:hypothetical protein n=1 Tax=Streptomyces sp. KS 21 TaxID=2485150 RepID=UPI00106279B0|nr:hypothetical protein [Streptomyces sp. KS 21]